MVLLPMGRLVVVMDALPLLTVAVPSVNAPEVKVTVPVVSEGSMAVMVTGAR